MESAFRRKRANFVLFSLCTIFIVAHIVFITTVLKSQLTVTPILTNKYHLLHHVPRDQQIQSNKWHILLQDLHVNDPLNTDTTRYFKKCNEIHNWNRTIQREKRLMCREVSLFMAVFYSALLITALALLLVLLRMFQQRRQAQKMQQGHDGANSDGWELHERHPAGEHNEYHWIPTQLIGKPRGSTLSPHAQLTKEPTAAVPNALVPAEQIPEPGHGKNSQGTPMVMRGEMLE
ncbi:MAG: hypothetical protein MMC23_002239 [Stictis urceolatum]|nr:hypothetical protein [Stictis urceolata]